MGADAVVQVEDTELVESSGDVSNTYLLFILSFKTIGFTENPYVQRKKDPDK